MKLYSIEYRSTFYGYEYRWLSMYNAAHGSWTTKQDAKDGGENHQKIIMMIHGLNKQILNGEQTCQK